MKLSDLLKYDDIVIQCHDNPDADALASGYGLYMYFAAMGKRAKFIYRGANKITKSNLLIMIYELEIPVEYEPDFERVPELLITVDCQYGQRNISSIDAKNIAVIDHHQVSGDLPELSYVRSNMGSCATIIWDLLRQEDIDANQDEFLATALYYGLYTDTNNLSEMNHPLDKDMADELNIMKSVITHMRNSNISLAELKITGKAIFTYDYHENRRYLIINSEKCDPNILGVISDFALETDGVDVCVAYTILDNIIKFSVRSCVKEVRADELAKHIAQEIGGGGGHITKAGGSIITELFEKEYINSETADIDFSAVVNMALIARIESYYDAFEIIHAKTYEINTMGMKRYTKLPQALSYIKATDAFSVGEKVEVRTMEGDIIITVEEDTCIMVGIAGEVYPIKEEKLRASYEVTNFRPNWNFEYEPEVISSKTGDHIKLKDYAKTCISTGKGTILAKPLDHPVKLFTAWDNEKYYSGFPGDYIAVRQDDLHDIYIINGGLFDKLYKTI